MATVKGKCEKYGKTYGYYANEDSARHNVSRHTCKKGGNCQADI